MLCLFVSMADVIAKWQMEWPLQGDSVFLLLDVIPRGQMDFMGRYTLVSSSEVLCRNSSHIWGRWYFPMFLFRDGLLEQPTYQTISSDPTTKQVGKFAEIHKNRRGN